MRRMWLEAWTAPSEPDEDTAPPKGTFPAMRHVAAVQACGRSSRWCRTHGLINK